MTSERRILDRYAFHDYFDAKNYRLLTRHGPDAIRSLLSHGIARLDHGRLILQRSLHRSSTPLAPLSKTPLRFHKGLIFLGVGGNSCAYSNAIIVAEILNCRGRALDFYALEMSVHSRKYKLN